jgi:MFS family permease
MNNYLGRRGTIFVTALILIATPIASGFSHSWQTPFVARLILGIGMGAKGGLCLTKQLFSALLTVSLSQVLLSPFLRPKMRPPKFVAHLSWAGNCGQA